MNVQAGRHETTGPTDTAGGRGPVVAFGLLMAGLALFRFVVMMRAGAPPGADGGNWLAFGHALFGERIRPSSIVYPPLVPVGLTVLAGLFGVTGGVAAFAALSSIAPGVAIYAVLRAQGLAWPAVLLAGITAASSVSSEPAAWGGYPQLLGIAFLVLFTWRLDAALRGSTRRAAIEAGVLLALVAATSHLVLAGAVLVAAALLGVHLAWPASGLRGPNAVTGLRGPNAVTGLRGPNAVTGLRGPNAVKRVGLRALGRIGLWLGAFLLPLVPLYARLLGSVGSSAANRGHGDVLGSTDLLRRLDLLHADFSIIGRVLLLAAPVVLVCLFPRRHTPLWAMAAASLASGAAITLLTREVRFLYLLPPAAVLALAVWFAELPPLRRTSQVATALLALALVVQVATGTRAFTDQVRYYAAIDERLTAAIEWIADETPDASVVAVSPVRDWPLSWWVEGLGHRRTFGAASLRWLNFPDERRRATVGNTILGLSAPSPDVLDRARAAGAAYVLVAKTWPGFSTAGLSEVRAAVVFENRSAVVLKT